jgi:hypothetical protein
MLLNPSNYAHNSPIAYAAVGAGKKVFTLALPRSNRRPEITAASERSRRGRLRPSSEGART